MNRENIIKLFDHCTFDELSEDNFEENIIDNLPRDFQFSYTNGVSKCVILPKDKPYVIKIPFLGSYETNFYNSNSYSNNINYDSIEFYEFHAANASKHHSWDYCYTEMMLYLYAKKYSINYPFCKTKLIGTTTEDNYPIYIQEYATIFSDTEKDIDSINKTEMSIRSSSICHEKGVNIFNTTWLTEALIYYGEKIFKRLLQFIEDFNIRDLHADNIGYIKNKPVLIDYSSWGWEI